MLWDRGRIQEEPMFLATLVLQYGKHQGGHCVGVHSRELVSVGADVYRCQCVLVYRCVL